MIIDYFLKIEKDKENYCLSSNLSMEMFKKKTVNFGAFLKKTILLS